MRNLLVIFITLISFSLFAQEELNALVSINSDQVQSTNKQVFRTLETALSEFINQTKWTNKNFLPQERIKCAFSLIVNQQDGNNFSASLQVQATRPVFGSSYETPILNTNDSDVNFQYNEFDPLIFNPNTFDSNLISTVVFYIYVILGIDADTFALNGGDDYFKTAQNVALIAQQVGGPGWNNDIGEVNRFNLIDNIMSQKFSVLRKTYYDYHRKGFDIFSENERSAKNQIANSIIALEKIFNITVGNQMLRFFLDAKSDEIVKVFSDGGSIGREQKLKDILRRIAPTFNNKWKDIED